VRILSLDFASHEGHIACIAGDVVRAIKVVGRVNDPELVPLLESVLQEANWAKTDIGMIACNLGPGGFTSVRSGVAFANALGDGLGVPLAGYHGSALMLARGGAAVWHAKLQPDSGAAVDWWIHSTRQDQVFVCGGSWKEPTLVTLAEAVAAILPGTTVAGDLLEAHRAAFLAVGASFPPLAPLHGVLPGFLAPLPSQKELLVPWYGRGI